MVQATILFGTETWVVSPRIGKTLGGLHHRVALWLALMRPRWYMTGRWVYAPLEAVIMVGGMDKVETFVLCH